jgi:hypothetical protein
MFQGGPLDGQTGEDPMAPPPEEEMDEAGRLDRILSDARSIAGADGDFSEQDKLIIEKVTTLLQQLKAGREKESEAALGGKLSPRLMSKAYGGGQ